MLINNLWNERIHVTKITRMPKPIDFLSIGGLDNVDEVMKQIILKCDKNPKKKSQ